MGRRFLDVIPRPVVFALFTRLWSTISTSDAVAARIEIEFTGHVFSAATDPIIEDPQLAGAIQVGDPFFGRFAYDPTIVIPTGPGTSYAYRSPEFLFELELGDARVSTDPADPELKIQILDDWLRSDGKIVDILV